MVQKHSNAKVTVWQRGFKYTLTNGYTLSVAFGPGNYCDNQNMPFHTDESSHESSNFEVAVFEPNGDIVDLVRTGDNELQCTLQLTHIRANSLSDKKSRLVGHFDTRLLRFFHEDSNAGL